MKTKGRVMTGWLAKYYDLRGPFNGAQRVNNKQLNLIHLNKGDRLLDVGCGTGAVIRSLHEKYGNSANLFGLDPSNDMIKIAKSKFPPDEANVKLSVGVGENLPFENNLFDWVVSSLTLHHLPKGLALKMLKDCYRVLKPRGNLIISDIGKPVTLLGRVLSLLLRKHAFVKESLDGRLLENIETAGFSKVKVQAVQAGLVYHITARKS